MVIDPVEGLRPARAADGATGLAGAAGDVPAADRTQANALEAALAAGLGESDRTASWLRLLGRGGALGEVMAAARSRGPYVPAEEQVGARLGYLARMCAALDEPEALRAVLAAVGSVPLSEHEMRSARGMVLRECVLADRWSW